MLKNILKLDGAQILSKNEQKNISGGDAASVRGNCPIGYKQCEIYGACLKLSVVCS